MSKTLPKEIRLEGEDRARAVKLKEEIMSRFVEFDSLISRILGQSEYRQVLHAELDLDDHGVTTITVNNTRLTDGKVTPASGDQSCGRYRDPPGICEPC